MIRVSLRRLEVFVALAEAGGFTAAAAQLGIAQASVSAHMRALENHLGLVLVERRRGRAGALSTAGLEFLDHARRLLVDAEQMSATVIETRQAARTQVILACQRLVANYIIPTTLAAFARRQPRLQLVIRTLRQSEVVEQLLGGSAELACFLSNVPPPALKAEVIGRERFLLVVARDHPLAGRRALSPAEIAAHPFIRADHGSHLGRELDRLLVAAGIGRVEVASRTTEYPMGRELVLAGVGVMLALERSLRPDLESGALVTLPLDGPPMLMDLCLAMSPRRAATPMARDLAQRLRRCAGA